MTFAKIIGDLIQGYSLKIAAGIGSCVLANEVYDFISHAFDPVTRALGGQ